MRIWVHAFLKVIRANPQYINIKWLYVFAHPLPIKQDVTEGKFYFSFFLSGIKLVLVQSFPSLQLVAVLICPTIYSKFGENIWIHTFPKDLSTKWNATKLLQELNSCHWVHDICYTKNAFYCSKMSLNVVTEVSSG